MIIRPAKLEDVPAMIEITREFFAVTEYSEFLTFSAHTVSALYTSLIAGDKNVILVVEIDGRLIGLTAALVFPSWLNADITIAQELLWWIEPAYRKKEIGIALLDALEAAVCEKGAVSFIVACLENLEPDRLARLYIRRGYKPFERNFIMGLSPQGRVT